MKNVNLGKYDLNQLLRNPGTIHRIQDNLMDLKGEGVWIAGIRDLAKGNIGYCIKYIISQYDDNPKEVTKLIGKETLKLIEEFEGITLADDIKNVL